MSLSERSATLRYNDLDGEHDFPLSRDFTSIGRSPDQDLVLREAFVSRRHALISRHNGSYELVDQQSSHGTFLNGVRVERAALKSGDNIQFGSLKAPVFLFHGPVSETAGASSGVAADILSALSVFAPAAENAHQPAQEMEKLSFLLNAARQLNDGGALNDIFRALLQLSLQLTGAERGFVFLREADQMRLALGLRSDGTVVDEDSTVSRRAMQKAIESQSKFLLSDTLADSSAAVWASVLANSIRCIYCIPLRKHISPAEPNRLLGLLYLDSQLGAGRMSEIDHQVLDTLAGEASTLLHNALLVDTELKARHDAEELAIAASIHSNLMALTMPQLSYAEVRARSVPCRAIGGDFYDAVELDDCVCVAIADVSGKGVSASIVAATLQGIIHALLLTSKSLPEIAALVNRFLCTRAVGKYATMILLKLYPGGRVDYLNCGHVPPLIVTEKETCELLASNLIVGLIADATYSASHCQLSPGERILLTTDGITEAEDKIGRQLGESGLDELAHLPTLDAMIEHVARFQASPVALDDWTLLDIRYTGV